MKELYLNKLLDKSQKTCYAWQGAGEGGSIYTKWYSTTGCIALIN